MTGVERIAAERKHQIEDRKFTLDHDEECHDDQSLLAASVFMAGEELTESHKFRVHAPTWAVNLSAKYQDDPVRSLAIAGALIAAEIDRLQGEP